MGRDTKKETPDADTQAATKDELGIHDAQALGLPAGAVEIEDAPIIAWEAAQGQLVQGTVHRIRPAGKGKVLDLIVDGDALTYGCPKILERKLDGQLGKRVAIMCTGKNVETANGTAWGFRVFVLDDAAEPAKA
jgi:hypothetical protein